MRSPNWLPTNDEAVHQRVRGLAEQRQSVVRFLLKRASNVAIVARTKQRTLWIFRFAGHAYGYDTILEFRQDELTPLAVLYRLITAKEGGDLAAAANEAALSLLQGAS